MEIERVGKLSKNTITTEFDLETGEIKRQYAVVEIQRKQIPGGFLWRCKRDLHI